MSASEGKTLVADNTLVANKTLVADTATLRALGRGRHLPHRLAFAPALLPLDSERHLHEARLNNLLRSCGCAEGTVGLFVGLGLSILWFFMSAQAWSAWHYAAALALPLVLLAVSKVARTRYDHRLFRENCLTLAALLESRGGQHEQVSEVGRRARV